MECVMFGIPSYDAIYNRNNKLGSGNMEYVNFKFKDLPRKEQVKLFELELDGCEIQIFNSTFNGWMQKPRGQWLDHMLYRVKPKPKPKTFGELTKE